MTILLNYELQKISSDLKPSSIIGYDSFVGTDGFTYLNIYVQNKMGKFQSVNTRERLLGIVNREQRIEQDKKDSEKHKRLLLEMENLFNPKSIDSSSEDNDSTFVKIKDYVINTEKAYYSEVKEKFNAFYERYLVIMYVHVVGGCCIEISFTKKLDDKVTHQKNLELAKAISEKLNKLITKE